MCAKDVCQQLVTFRHGPKGSERTHVGHATLSSDHMEAPNRLPLTIFFKVDGANSKCGVAPATYQPTNRESKQ